MGRKPTGDHPFRNVKYVRNDTRKAMRLPRFRLLRVTLSKVPAVVTLAANADRGPLVRKANMLAESEAEPAVYLVAALA